MKVLVVHDAQGAIHSLGFASTPRPGVTLKPSDGKHVSVVEIDEIEHAGHLMRYTKGYRVDLASGKVPKLVKR